jgi:hypothetical protein
MLASHPTFELAGRATERATGLKARRDVGPT